MMTLTTSCQKIWQSVEETSPTSATLGGDSMLETLDIVCDLVIPSTETPGAKAVGVSQWILGAVDNGLLATSTGELQRFAELLSTDFPFLQSTAAEQSQILAAIDNRAYIEHSQDETSLLWQKFKTLILMGYYTSEVGASQELHYELVPGRFIPDVEIKDGITKAWSNDWTAVDFG
ncbi:gluconate 2-dehydrogenase subunit 3 family protein [Parahaliea maris]|nr:gluconate 2-dehydrogenase subunit 3 family protein [Parahaliea maris]